MVIGMLPAVNSPEFLVANLASWCSLLVRRAFGTLGQSFERFYPGRAITLVGMLVRLGPLGS